MAQVNQVQNNIVSQSLTEQQLTEIVNARVQQALNAAAQENIALRATAEAAVTRLQNDAHQHVSQVQAAAHQSVQQADLEKQRTMGIAEVALLEANARKSSVEEENLRLKEELKLLKEAQLVSQKLETRNASPSTPPRRSRPPRPGSSGYRSPTLESIQSFQTAGDLQGEDVNPAPIVPQIPPSLQASAPAPSSTTAANETKPQWYGDLWQTVKELKDMMQEMQMRNEEDDVALTEGNLPTVTGSTATSSLAAIAPTTTAARAPSPSAMAALAAPLDPATRTRSKSVEFRKGRKRSTSAKRRHRSSSSRRRKGSRPSDSSDSYSSRSHGSSSSSTSSPRSSSTSTGKRSGVDDDDDYDEDELAKWLHKKMMDKRGHWYFPGERSETASWILKSEKEKDIYTAKSLASFSLSTLPKTAGQFHLWVPAICSATPRQTRLRGTSFPKPSRLLQRPATDKIHCRSTASTFRLNDVSKAHCS